MRELERNLTEHLGLVGLVLLATGGSFWEIAIIRGGPPLPVWSTICAMVMLVGAAVMVAVGVRVLLRKFRGTVDE